MTEPIDTQSEIKDEDAYRTAMTAVGSKSRPPAVLRFIVQALEGYRSTRKMGWSRPWNKYGGITHQSFRLSFPADGAFVDAARAVLAAECADMPDDARAFVDDLLADGKLMGFIFVIDLDEDGQKFEGATLGFGRMNGKRFRDRLDLIFEAPVAGDCANPFSRLRVFVDPYRETTKDPLWTSVVDGPASSVASGLMKTLSDASWDWAENPDRLWDHWTSAYIDYFGPRTRLMRESHFYTPGRASTRLAASGPTG